MKKRILALITSVTVAVTMLAGSTAVTFADEQKVDADVTVRIQMANAYVHDLKSVNVSSDLAESYVFKDNVPQAENVSALDVMVKSHIMSFGNDFRAETADEYLKVDGKGYISKLYGYETYASGFLVNQGFPNDGSESSYGGYNGTTVSTQKVVNGDVVDFFVYNDESKYSDKYSYVDMAQKVTAGSRINVTLKGVSVMNGYRYKDPASMKAAAEALKDVKIAYVDISNGAVNVIGDTVSDEKGNITFTTPEKTGTYYITPYSDNDNIPVLMNPQKITVTSSFGKATLGTKSYTYSGKAKKPSVIVKDKEGHALIKGNDYTVSYKNNTKVGTATVTVKGTGIYNFSQTLKFKINPPKAKLVKVKALGGKKIKVSWKKQKKQTTGYQIRYSAHKSMSKSKYVTVKKNSTTWKRIWKVGKGKKYVQIRTYKKVNGTKYYSSWSASKSVKVR